MALMSASTTGPPPAAPDPFRDAGPIGRTADSRGPRRPRSSAWVEASMVVPALVVFVGLLVVPVGYAVSGVLLTIFGYLAMMLAQ